MYIYFILFSFLLVCSIIKLHFVLLLVLIESFKQEYFKNLFKILIFCLRTWFSTLLLYCSTHAYLISPDEGSCYVFLSKTFVAIYLHLLVLFCNRIFYHIGIIIYFHSRNFNEFYALKCLFKDFLCERKKKSFSLCPRLSLKVFSDALIIT